MGTQEYRKIIDVMAGSLEAGKAVDLNYLHDTSRKLDVIDVTMTTAANDKIECRVLLRQGFLELTFNKRFFTPAKYQKFISRFEYDLEQSFGRNIHLDSEEETLEYKIKLEA
ncbi:MAG: hypothetical protein KBA61_06290 [Spirochaetes bacterium]|nr:hypothetical protein [Spirochaetota bacterium]